MIVYKDIFNIKNDEKTNIGLNLSWKLCLAYIRWFSDKDSVWFLKVVMDLYLMMTSGCLFRKVLTSPYILPLFEKSVFIKKHKYAFKWTAIFLGFFCDIGGVCRYNVITHAMDNYSVKHIMSCIIVMT